MADSKKMKEDLILTGVDVGTANTVRMELLQRYPRYWYYVYQNGDITAATEFQGPLPEKTIKELSKFATELADMLISPATQRDETKKETSVSGTLLRSELPAGNC